MAIITNRYIVLVLLLVAAITSYAFGVSDGVWLFVGLGMALEGCFWMKLFGKRRRYATTMEPEDRWPEEKQSQHGNP